MRPCPMSFQALRFRPVLLASLTLALLGASAGNMCAAITPDPSAVRVTADRQNYSPERKRYNLNGNVTVAFQDVKITGKVAEMELNNEGKPNVAHFFNRPMYKRIKAGEGGGDDIVLGDTINLYLEDDRFGAEGNVISTLNTVAAAPFLIRSDVQQFDNKNKVVSASGNVQVNYQGSEASGSLANVRMTDGGKAERVIFSGGARIKKETSLITGDRITVMVDSGNLIAEHGVKTEVDLKPAEPARAGQAPQPTKVKIDSDYQQYDKASDMMIASGNVRILYGDYFAVGPKATFKLRGGQLDRIFLTGRPTITESGRTITADKITITTNPQNFDAVGNVKVNFKSAGSPKPGQPGGGGKPASGGTKPAGGSGKPLPKDDPSDY